MADWPAWFYGPNGEAEIFASEADVPDGWRDTPAPAVDAPETPKRGPGRPRRVADDGDGA
jgi:hypothetical protein